ncbi:MAG: OmpA family protein, partial [Bacteroidales bacterium]|nr:OmpA family protein [Bacteroidales bacterium]
MKKALLILSSLLVLGFSASAQDVFYPGWQFGIKAGASYTAGLPSFSKLISGPTIAAGAGYQFTPVWTLRGEVSAYEAKGGYNVGVNDAFIYKFNYVQLNADVVVDLCNIFKYRATRCVNPYIFAGIGLNTRFNDGAINSAMTNREYIWDKTVLGFTGRVGAGIDFRVNQAIAISLELVDNFHSNKFNAYKEPRALDQLASALLGVKFTFGQANKRAAAEAAAAAAAAKAAADAAEAARLAAEKAAREKAEAERLAAEKAAREAAEAARLAAEAAAKARQSSNNVMFKIGKYNLDKKAKAVISDVAEFMGQHPDATIMVSGYADKETGYPARNLYLSKKRAENVASALKKAGVDADKINTEYFGDTKKISEIPAENRTAVCVT